MRFGMPTLIEIKSVEACAMLCRELGLDFIELNMNLPHFQAEKLNLETMRRISEEYGIYYTIHLDENLSPCDFNDKIAAAYTETVLQTIVIAKHLNVPVINMHLSPGVWFTLPDRKVFLFDEYRAEYLLKLKSFRDSCAAAIGDADLKICVENSSGYNQARFLEIGLDVLLENPVFGLTFDIGHNANGGSADESIIMKRADRLYHMHIHDAIGKEKCDHLALGEGNLDLRKYLHLAQNRGSRVVLEVKTVKGLRQSVEWLKNGGIIYEA